MGKAELPLHAPGTRVDRGYIGESVPRPNAQRLLQGRGAFTDDLRFPRLAHVAFFGAGATPVLATRASKESSLEAAQKALEKDLQPPADLYHSSATKLHLAKVLLGRAWNTLSKPH